LSEAHIHKSIQPVMVKEATGGQNLETSVEQEKEARGNDRKTAMYSDITEPNNLRRYEKEIDGVFDGNFPIGSEIIIGRTPKKLTLYGAPDLPLHMTQSTARKIAYPEGYQGGKHNLGIKALKELPNQLVEPIAILINKSHPNNSVVVITEWINQDGERVIIPVQFNKQGAITVQNNISSAFGRNDMSQYLGENSENVIYTKNNEDINQLLSHGRQLPEAMTDNIFYDTNIPQDKQNVNSDKNGETATLQGENQSDIIKQKGVSEDVETYIREYLRSNTDSSGRYGRGGASGTTDGSRTRTKTIESQTARGQQRTTFQAIEPKDYTSVQRKIEQEAYLYDVTPYIVQADTDVVFDTANRATGFKENEIMPMRTGKAFIDIETHTVFFAFDAKENTAWHEIFHSAKARNPELAQKLIAQVERAANKDGKSYMDYAKIVKRTYNDNFTDSLVMEELTSEFFRLYKEYGDGAARRIAGYFQEGVNLNGLNDAAAEFDNEYLAFIGKNRGSFGKILETDTGISKRMSTDVERQQTNDTSKKAGEPAFFVTPTDADANNAQNTTEGVPSQSINFAKQVDAVISGTHPTNQDLYIGDTADVLKNIGFEDYPMLMKNSKIREILDKHSEMSVNLIKKIPELLENPAMIIKSKTHGEQSVVVITDQMTDKGYLVLPVWFDQNGHIVDIGLDYTGTANFVASAYGRNMEALLEYAFSNDENVLYADKQKSQSLANFHGLQLPAQVSKGGFMNKIHPKAKKVKSLEDVPSPTDADAPPRKNPPIPTESDAPSAVMEYVPKVTDADAPPQHTMQ
ncbi:MAG: hypothetical protein RR580_07415, partial [Christensenellaceae bacterium]